MLLALALALALALFAPRLFKILFDIKAQLDKPFEQLIGGHADKVS